MYSWPSTKRVCTIGADDVDFLDGAAIVQKLSGWKIEGFLKVEIRRKLGLLEKRSVKVGLEEERVYIINRWE